MLLLSLMTINMYLQSAFYDCTSLREVSLPTSLIYIYVGSFAGTGALQSIVIPSLESLTSYPMFSYNIHIIMAGDCLHASNEHVLVL